MATVIIKKRCTNCKAWTEHSFESVSQQSVCLKCAHEIKVVGAGGFYTSRGTENWVSNAEAFDRKLAKMKEM